MMPVLYLIGCASVFGGLIGFGWWSTRRSERAALEWVSSFHGERLPPAETLKNKGYSTTWLLTVMPYYLEQAREDERKKRPAKQLGTPINPDTESDCPECANGMPHEQCRSGWKDVLRAAAKRANQKREPEPDVGPILYTGVAQAPPPRNECRICGDYGLYPGLNAYGGGLCPGCGKKASKRC